ncbi:MAG: IS481 family transposase [Actinobacteria bacterium]|nr:IS481 family transposase [Actinomycetota bacterium]
MVELRREVLLEVQRTGEPVASVCQRFGISRATYYRYRTRYLLEGLEGLEDRSQRPNHMPARMDPQVEIEICQMRKAHPRWGARRIQGELERKGIEAPAPSSIHQALRRNHLVADQPPRRPKAFTRFQRKISNDLWQIDATQVKLANRKKVWIVDMLDDHSRYLLSAHAAKAPTGDAAWDCFEEAVTRYGLPRQVLSDNGLCFTGRLHGVEVEFERGLKDLGIEMINSGPYHPQTLGKLERFHKTLKLWLADEGPAEDLVHLQELLDGFRHHYNTERPHQGIDNLTPVERYRHVSPTVDGPISAGLDDKGEPTYPPRAIVRKVSSIGNLGYKGSQINIGVRFAHARVRVVDVGDLTHIYWGEELVRVLKVDPSQPRHPLRKKRIKLGSVS